MERFITLMVIGCFIVLCCYAFGRADALRPHPVSVQRITGEPDMDVPIAAAKIPPKATNKEVNLIFKRIMKEAKAHEDAVTIAKIYGVTPQNIDADIFGGAR